MVSTGRFGVCVLRVSVPPSVLRPGLRVLGLAQANTYKYHGSVTKKKVRAPCVSKGEELNQGCVV